MKKTTTIKVKYLPKHNTDDVNAWNGKQLTDKFRLTGKWGIESQFHPAVIRIPADQYYSHTLRIEVVITDSYEQDNPEYVELTWYQSRVEKIEQQPKHITVTYTEKYWIDEGDFHVSDHYDPEWVEFDCNE